MSNPAKAQRPEANLRYGLLDSPVGPLLVAGDGHRLHLIRFATERRQGEPDAGWRRDDALFAEAFRQIGAYFAGDLTQFSLPLHQAGTTFQTKVWEAMRTIPYGETTSYGALAAMIARPGASRAVGAASGANPLPIVVPCHRVVGWNRSLTGFGGGIKIKRFLLAHEQKFHPKAGERTDVLL
jgi:methylated-DNA-[protein]-cysteine S-methyltransferase